MMNANNSNYYEILGVDSNVNSEGIKRAYRRLSLIYHPDKHNNDVDKVARFKQLNDAYNILSNVEIRRQYDRDNNIGVGVNGLNTEKNINFINNNNDVDRINTKNQYFHCKNNMNQNTFKYNEIENNHTNHSCINRHNTLDIQDDMIGLNSGLRYKQIKPRPIEISKEITLTESYFGTSIVVNIAREIRARYEKYRETETVYIDVEPGTDNDEIIVIREKGNIIDDICGDLRVKILLREDNDKKYNFKRRGLDLVYTKSITLKESLCGFTFMLKHINGRQYTINNNTGIVIHPNYNTIIPKLGFKKGSMTTGNLIIKYDIEYPERLDEECRERLHEIL